MNFLVIEGRRLSRRLRLGLRALGGDFNLLVDDLFEGKLDLEGGWRLAWADLNARRADRLEADGGTGEPVGSRNQPGKLESPSIASRYRTSLLRQSSAQQGADRARNGCAVRVYYLSLKLLSVRKGPLGDKWDAQDQQQGQADTL
jgi:hypothetical protein